MKDWSKERWRKLYLRESIEQRLWSVMARGLRDYLIRLAEDDGALIRDSAEPVEDLLRALGAHAGEADWVRAAIELLRRDGFLGGNERSLFVRNLPAAQAWEPRAAPTAGEPPTKLTSTSSSNERVRQFRERQRLVDRSASAPFESGASTPADALQPGNSGASDSVTSAVTDAVTSPVTGVTGNVSLAVTSPVTSSRGSRNLKSSESFLDLQKDKQRDPHPSSTRASSVTSTVTSAVTGVTSSVTSGVSSGGRRGDRADDDEDENESYSRADREQAVENSVHARAIEVRDHPEVAAVSHPERWPEVQSVAQAFSRAAGLAEQRLGQYGRDPGVRALVDLYAAGFTQAELERVVAIVPKLQWWRASNRRLGLSSLSIEVVRRNLPGLGPPREMSPTVAKVLAGVQRRREAG